MQSRVTEDTFRLLLNSLDPDRERAGTRYEDLRRVLIRFFEWRGAPFPEEHADETFDRVSKRLGDGVAIANMGGYCYEVARLVLLETVKSADRRHIPFVAGATAASRADALDDVEAERRLDCLERCLEFLPPENRELILAYYGDDGSRIDHRRRLAEKLGVQRDALANRAQRIRNKLEECVSGCMTRRSAI